MSIHWVRVGSRFLLSAVLALALLAGSLSAATYTWSNGAADSTWSSSVPGSLDWSGSSWTDGNAAYFGSTGAGGITVSGPVAPTGMTFTSSGYTFSGGTINLGSLGITDNAAGINTINSAVAVTAGQTWTIATGGTLADGGAITGSSNISKAGAGALILTGNLSGFGGTFDNQAGNTLLPAGSTPGGKWKVDSGLLDLNGGNVSVIFSATGSQSSPVLQNSAATPATVNVYVGSGENYGFNGMIASPGSGGLNLVVTATGSTGGSSLTLSGSNTFSGSITINGFGGNGSIGVGCLGINADAALGAATNSLTLNNGATLCNMTGNNGTGSFSAGFNVALGASRTIYVTGGTDSLDTGYSPDIMTVNSLITGTGSLYKIDGGGLTLTNANTLTGSFVNSAGPLTLQNSLALQNSTFLPIGGSVVFSSSVGSHAFTLGGLGGSLGLSLLDSAGNAVALSVGNNNANTTYTGVLSGSGSLTKIGTGALTLGNADTFTGATLISAGTLALNNAGALATSSVNVGGAGTLSFVTPTSGTLAGLQGSGTVNLLNAGSAGVALAVGSSSSATTFSGNISGAGGSLTLIGTNTLTLSGSNSYSGGTTINNGTVVFATSSSLPASGNITIAGGALGVAGPYTTVNGWLNSGRINTSPASGAIAITGTSSEAINFTTSPGSNYANLSLGAFAAASYSGVLTPSGTTYRLGGGGGTLYYIPTITGNNSLLIGAGNSGGTVVLTTSNTYTGITTVSNADYFTNGTILSLNSPFANPAIPGNLHIGVSGASGNNTATVNLAQSQQIASSAVIFFDSTNPSYANFNLDGNNQTVAGISAANIGGQIEDIGFGQTGINTTGTLTLNVPSGGNYTYAGTLRNQDTGGSSSGSGLLALVLSGSGQQTLSGATITYTGPTTISGGTLNLLNTTAFASAVSVGANSMLNISYSTTGFASRKSIAGNSITGAGVINVNNAPGIAGGWDIMTGGSALNFSGTININSGVLSTDSSGVIKGTATVNVASGGVFSNHSSSGVTIGALNGAGDVTPAQTNNGTYNLTVGAGNASGSFTGIIHGNNSVTTDGTIEAGYLSFTKIGTGTEVLTGANTYTGATAIDNGTLLLNFAAAGAPSSNILATSTNQLTIAGGTLNLSGGTSGSDTETIGPLGVNAGGLVIANSGASMTLSAASINRAAGGTMIVDLSQTAGGSNTLTLNSTTGLNPTATGIVGFLTVKDSLGTGLAMLSGNNIVRNTTTTALTTTSNNAAIDYTTTPGDPGYASGTITLSGVAGATDSLSINATTAGTLNLGGNTLSMTSGALLLTGSGNYTISSGQIGASGAELIVNQLGSGALTLAGSMSGASKLTIGGGGTVYLTAANAYTGGTYLGDNLLNINADTALGGTSSGLTFTGDGTLQAGANNISLVSTRGIVLNAGVVGTIDTQANTMTINGAITGAGGGLTKIGAGLLILANSTDNYSGATTISAGTLQLQNTATSGAANFVSAVSVGPNGTLVMVNSTTGFAARAQIAGSAITGSGVIDVNNAGLGINGGWDTMIGANALNFSGTININTGTFATDSAGGVQGTAIVNISSSGCMALHNATNGWTIGALNGFGDVSPAQGTSGPTYTLTVGAGNLSGSYAGIIHGNNSVTTDGTIEAGYIALTKIGTGTQILSGAETFTGATTITAGTLQLQDTSYASTITVGPSGTLNLVNTAAGFASRATIAGNDITGNGVINVNNSGTGIAGGWVRVNTATALNFYGTINVNSGVFATDGAGSQGVIAGAATVNVGPNGVFSIHDSAAVTIGALNGSGAVTPAQGSNGTYNLTLGAANSNGTFSGIIHGNNSTSATDGSIEAGYLSLTKIGSGTQVLSGPNTYTAATVISGGTLQVGDGVANNGGMVSNIQNNAALVFANPSATGYGGVISGSGGTLTKTGTGTLYLFANSTYSGPTVVNNGTVHLGSVGVTNFGSTGAGWTVTNNANISSTPITTDVLKLTDGGGNEARSAFFNTPVSPINGFTANFTYMANSSGTTADGITFILQNDSRGTAAIGGYGGFFGYATGNGGTGITPSVAIDLNLYNNVNQTAYDSYGAINATQMSTTGALSFHNGDPINVAVNYNATTQVLLWTLTDSLSSSLTFSASQGGVNLQSVSSALVGFAGGTGGNTATQTISGFTFTPTAVNNILPTTTALSLSSSGAVDLGGINQTVGSLTGAGTVTNSIAGTTSLFTAGGDNSSQTFSGVLQNGAGALAVTKAGTGAWSLGGANTYTGGTTISTGTLALLSGGTLGAGSITVSPSAMFDVSALTGGFTLGSGTLTAGRSGPAATDINGSLNINNAYLSVYSPTATGTLSISGSLGLNGSTVALVPGSLIAVGGGLALSGTDYIVPTTALSSGTTNLATYSGAAPNTAGLEISGLYGSNPRQQYGFVASGGVLSLTVSGVAGSLQWTGASSGVWYSGSGSQNWFNTVSTSADNFYAGDNVTFSDSGFASPSVTISGSVAPGSVIVSNSAVNYTFSGGPIIGGTSLFKTGPGMLTITQSNTYTGGTTINGGILQLAGSNLLNTAGGITTTGGTLDLGGQVQATSGLISFQGGGAQDGILMATATPFDAESGNISATLAGSAALNKTTSGTVVLSGSNTYTGGTNIMAGLLQLTGGNNRLYTGGSIVSTGGTLDLGGGSQSSSAAISFQGGVVQDGTLIPSGSTAFDAESGIVTAVLAGSAGLTKTTTGTIVLGGANVYSGATTINGGVAQLSAGSNRLPTATTLTTNSGTLDLNGQSQQVALLSGTGGGIINSSATDATFTISTGTSSAGNYGGLLSTTGSGKLNLVFNSTAGTAGTSAMALTNTANNFVGNITINGNGYSTGQDIYGGLLGIISDSALGNPANNITLNNGGVLDNMYTVASGGGWSSHSSIVTDRTITLSGSAGGVIRVGYGTSPNFSTFTINGQITGSGGLTTTDGGTVILTNSNNNWQGGTTISNMANTQYGTLMIGANNALPVGTTLTMQPGVFFDLGGYSQQVAGLSGSGTIGNSRTTPSTLVYNGAGTSTYAGVIQNVLTTSNTTGNSTVALAVAAGGLVLTGNSSYTGGTSISAGTLQLGNGLSSNGSVVGNISNNSSLIFANPLPLGYAGVVSGSGSLTKTGAGTLLLSANQSYTGPTVISSGTVRLGSPAAATFGTNGTGWNVNNYTISGTPITNNVLTLTDGLPAGNEARSAFYDTPVSPVNGFTASFTYSPNGGTASTTTADGMAFIFQDDSRGTAAIGGAGGSFGYGTTGSITPSVAIEFNMYSNVTQTGYDTNGSLTHATSANPVSFHNGDPINISVSYNANTQDLFWTLTDSVSSSLTFSASQGGVNLQSVLGNVNALIGFSGGDGGSVSTQLISNFMYAPTTAANNILPTTTALSLAAGSTLDLYGINQTVASLSGSGTVTNTSANATSILTTGGGSSQTFAGTLADGAGFVGLAKTGSGTLTLTGNNAYSGGTYVGGGTLQLGNNAALGLASGALTVNSGVLDLAGYNPAVASLSGSAGVITNNGSALATLDLVGAAATTFSGSLRDGTSPVALQLDGATLTLAGVNTHSGPTTINTGSLIAAAAGVLSANSAVTVSYGTLDVTAGSQSVAALTVGGAATLNLGIGNVLTSFGAVNFNGTLNITGATSALSDLIAYPNVTYNMSDGTFSMVDLNGVPLSGFTLAYNAHELDLIAPAGPATWSSSGGGSWATPGNWSPSSVPSGQGVVAILGTAALAPATVTLDGAQTLGSLTFNNANGYTLTAGSGGSLTMDNTGGTGDAQIVVLSGSHSIDATVALTLAGSNTAISAVNSGALSIAGNILDGTGNGSAALTFSSSDGTGLLTLSGSNTFGGGLYVASGEVILNGAGSLLAGSTLTIGGGASGAVFVPPAAGHATANLAPVPEPGTLALLAVLWTAVACYRFARRPASRNT